MSSKLVFFTTFSHSPFSVAFILSDHLSLPGWINKISILEVVGSLHMLTVLGWCDFLWTLIIELWSAHRIPRKPNLLRTPYITFLLYTQDQSPPATYQPLLRLFIHWHEELQEVTWQTVCNDIKSLLCLLLEAEFYLMILNLLYKNTCSHV